MVIPDRYTEKRALAYKAYPSIERADILACLNYAAFLAGELVTPIAVITLRV